MESPARRHAAVFVVPMIVGLVAAQRAAPHVRTVDFLLLFASVALALLDPRGRPLVWYFTRGC
jgi:hypothetical protein